jgi:ABC-type antimicrobial peptide transport system permease subunit
VERAVRQAVREEMPNAIVGNITTLEAQIDSSLVPERLLATLSALFAALGVTLAGIGIYGLLAYTVARRTKEIGIRIALGAKPVEMARQVAFCGLGMVVLGLTMGIPLAFAAHRIASALVADLTAPASTAWLVAAGAIIGIAILACYLPARRAARLDPLEALRHE